MLHVIKIEDGELMKALTERCAEYGIRSAAIVSLIGAADEFTISTMPLEDATKDNLTTYRLPAELHGCGEIVDGTPHIHATMGVHGDVSWTGHLHEAHIRTHFVRVYVQPL